ncbi:unnamed protein product [Sphenostylis stenocarpa]|uniref:Secreted protein n=1 Tax=Sphenostylis stenocarpa TaxID=92480 RepID=A0AA86VUV3_9FABA|nr:unnamed protein product [Sphenostylis stenocarpa]
MSLAICFAFIALHSQKSSAHQLPHGRCPQRIIRRSAALINPTLEEAPKKFSLCGGVMLVLSASPSLDQLMKHFVVRKDKKSKGGSWLLPWTGLCCRAEGTGVVE